MLEDILQLGVQGFCPDQIQPLKALEAWIEMLFELGDHLENDVEKDPPNDRGLLENPLRLHLETIEPCGDNPLDGWRHICLTDWSRDAPATFDSGENS